MTGAEHITADSIRNLEKAGALIATEIDRLQAERAATRAPARTTTNLLTELAEIGGSWQ